MLDLSSVPGSDDWYLMRLCEKLGQGLPRMYRLKRYRDGDAIIPDSFWEGTREAYMRFMRRSRLHVVETVRDARTNRQKVVGFRTGAPGDEAGDVLAWKNWRGSRMGVQSRQFFNDTADYGAAQLLTQPDANGKPIIQTRNGWDTVTEPDPMRPWESKYALTVTFDAKYEVEFAVMYGQGWYRIAVRRTKFPTIPTDGTAWVVNAAWTWATDRIPTPYTNLNLVVENTTVDGYGVYEKHLDTVDRINEVTLQALTLIVMQAYKQRAVSGNLPEVYPADHPQAGQRIEYNEIFKGGPAALWMLPLDAKMWESTVTDVRPVYEARKSELETLASLTSTPQYVFQGDSANQSANGADLAREQIVFAVDAMNELAEIPMAHAQAVAFQILGDAERSNPEEIEVMWAKTNPSSLAERSDAAPKFKAGGATQAWIDEHVLEMTPGEQRQAVQDRLTEAFQASIAGGTVGNTGTDPPNS